MLHTRDAAMNSSQFLPIKRCAVTRATGSTHDGNTWKHFLRFLRTLRVTHRTSGHGTDRLLFLSQATGPSSSSPDEWKIGGFSEPLKDFTQAHSLTESLCNILCLWNNFIKKNNRPWLDYPFCLVFMHWPTPPQQDCRCLATPMPPTWWS